MESLLSGDSHLLAPLADRVARFQRDPRVRNFHALPLSGVRRTMTGPWVARFDRLYGALADSDVSFAAPALDSFFAPTGALALAEELAAEAFGVEAALFGSCGTSLANRVVLAALGGDGARILLDGASHQSLTFGARGLGMDVSVIEPNLVSGCAVPDLDGIIGELSVAVGEGRPYDIVALTAASYDGYLVRMDQVLPKVIAASPSTAIVIDSAWAAIHSFSERIRPYTALDAVVQMKDCGVALPKIVLTTSAHKSLCALRQASLILVANGRDVLPSLRSAQFTHHTTSPSWPILASLDLACGHAAALGNHLIEQAIGRRDRFVNEVTSDPLLAQLLPEGADRFTAKEGLIQDPLKVVIAKDPLGNVSEVRRILFDEHNIYISRCNATGFLLNFTIGITDDDVTALLDALRIILWGRTRRSFGKVSSDFPMGVAVREYVVPYPPGIPIARPGDVWTPSHDQVLAAEVAAGAEIFCLPQFALERI